MKLYWKTKNSLAYSNGSTFALWGHILLSVARKRTLLHNGNFLEPGQCVISISKTARWLKVHKTTAAKYLKAFEVDGMIRIEKTDRNGTTISVCNWRTYQQSEEGEAMNSDRNGTAREPQENRNCTQTENPKKVKKVKSPKKNSSRSASASPEDLALASWMYEQLLQINPGHRKPSLEAWANDIRLLRERDGRTHEQIRELFSWANADDFWSGNIQCPAKLRKQWDQLTMKSKRVGNSNRSYANAMEITPMDIP